MSDFGRLRNYGRFFNSRTRPRVNRVKQLVCHVLTMDAADVIRNSEKLLRATRAVHNRTAACVAAGGGIFENQL